MSKTFKAQAAQGDILFVRVDELPADVKESNAKDGKHIVAHSETGHHHLVDAREARFFNTPNPFICYLQIDGDYTDLTHNRSFDTHETLKIPNGTWKIVRQREYTPEGFRRVED